MKTSWKHVSSLLLMTLLGIGVAHANTVTYIYIDPQGTPLAEADLNGNITATFDYAPYGNQALGTPPNGPGYTGHVNDPDTGLVYMQARYYDPATGRFLSIDPVRPEAGNAFNFSRYSYANDNPVMHTDPDGRQCNQCLYYGDSVDHQASINAGASGKALAMIGASLPFAAAVPAAGFVTGTAAAVATDSITAGSLTVGIMANASAVAASGAIVAEGVAAANGAPSPFSAEALVVRGGNAANQTAAKIDGAIMESRTPGVVGFSCQCDGGTNLSALGANLRNNQLGVTTVGAIRAAGGEVVSTPGFANHVTVTGLSGEQASPLMMIQKNPNPAGSSQ